MRDRLRTYEEKRPLYDAINKYGPEHFLIEEIEKCSIEEVNDREIYWIEYYNTYHNGYNATKGGDGKHYLDYDLIISTYNELQNMKKVSEKIGCSYDSIRKILHSNNIEIKSSQEIAKENGKKCAMLKDNEVIQIFNSLSDAARFIIKNNLTTTNNVYNIASCIGKACKQENKKAYGYFWKSI